MRRSRLAAARAGHVRKRGQPCGRQRNVGSPRGPHLMVSTSMVYGCIIDVFNTEDISAECPRRLALRSCYDYVLGLCGRMKDVVGRVFRPPSLFRGFAAKPRATLGMDGGLGCCRLFGALLYSFCWMKSPLFLQGCILDLYVHRISYSASKILRCPFCV